MSMLANRQPGAEVYYPEGPQVPEGDMQMRRRIELAVALRSWVSEHHPDAWVCCDINIYYREGDPRVVVAPDVAVAFGVNIPAVENKSTYKVWEAGAIPSFVLEIASVNTYRVDLHEKPAKFADLGVSEYWRLDPTGGDLLDTPLAGERWQMDRWEPIAVSVESPISDGVQLRGHSDVLGLDLCWAPPKLRLYHPATSTWLRDHEDEAARADAAEARADAAEARADAAEAQLAALRHRL
ncbi:Uma2 family endonuclease [Candidatus Poriferisocius sp.]|uniref:Uma2 family endonuclease n=1 Tax=Candidatus Poriferisocius sp. TaxID=3101276 RepID=UPI003B51C00E